jgi:PBP1b-binding outer membrane lipoprotein LpoB
MTKIIATASIAALTVLLAAGCSSSPKTEAPAASLRATPVSTIPKPDAAQTVSLRAEFAKINPLFDNDKSVDNARNQCTSILGESPADKLVDSAKARFTGGQVKSVTDAEAQQIIDVIKANGFCKA